MEGTSSPRPGPASGVKGMSSAEGDKTVPEFGKEGFSGRGLSPSPALYPRRVRRKSRKCGICPQDEEETGFFFRLGQSLDGDCWPMPDPLQSAGPQRLISCKDSGPGDAGESRVEQAPEAEFESLLFPKNAASLGSLDHLFGFPELFGDESLSLVTQDPPQSPALCPGVLTGASTEEQRAQPLFVDGSSGTPPDPEGPEVSTQPVLEMGLGQGLTAPAEPVGSLSGASLGWRRPRGVKRQWQRTVPCAPKQRTENASQDHPEEVIQRNCPGVEMRVPFGVKLVYYVCSGPVIQLLGAFSNSQPGGQLEALEDLMKCDLTETETEEPFQQKTEDPDEQETMLWDGEVRSTVIRTMQEVLWTRVQELPDLLLREEEVEGIAEAIEDALFRLTQDTNLRYKTKYRSLLFNLRDPRNSDLFLKVAHCDVSPQDLVQMSSIQLAPKELSRWRDQEQRRGLDIIEQQQKEVYGLPTSKLTHKGEVEIPRDSDQMLTLEDLMVREPMMPQEYSPQALTTPLEDTADQHQYHSWPSDTCKDGKDVNSSWREPHVGISHNMDWKSSTKLSGFSRAIPTKKENVILKAPSPAPGSSPEMVKGGEIPPEEPRDRLQMPSEPKKVLPSPPLWEGSLDMFSIKHFRAKAQLVLGHGGQLIQALPEIIRSAGCLRSNDLWDLLDSMCPATKKDISVIRLCPHGSQDIQNYRMLYSYLNNKQCHCLARVQPMKMVLLPLPAFQPLPARLRPLGGPGLEAAHTSLLLAVLFPKDGLPDTALSNPVWNKIPKTVSFSKKVRKRHYKPENGTSETTMRGSPSHEEAPKQSLAEGILAPRNVCAPQCLPRGRGRQGPGWGQQSPEASWYHPQYPNSGGPVFPGVGHEQHLHRASCLHHDLLQHLKVLVTMSHQFQASLGQGPLPPSSAVSAVPDPPGPTPDPSLDPSGGGGFECLWPERPDPSSDPPGQECSFPYQC